MIEHIRKTLDVCSYMLEQQAHIYTILRGNCCTSNIELRSAVPYQLIISTQFLEQQVVPARHCFAKRGQLELREWLADGSVFVFAAFMAVEVPRFNIMVCFFRPLWERLDDCYYNADSSRYPYDGYACDVSTYLLRAKTAIEKGFPPFILPRFASASAASDFTATSSSVLS